MVSFSRLLALSSLALAASAAVNRRWGEPTQTVTVAAAPTATTVSECNTAGGAQCCQSTTNAGSSSGSAVLGLLGIVLSDLEDVIGLGCSPITVGQSCSYEPVCCSENGIGNLVSVGCIPLTL